MEPLDSVALGIVHRSGSGSHIKCRHCNLKDVCYKSRPIVRMDYRRDAMVREVIPDKVLDHRLSLLVFEGTSGEPSGVNIDDGEKRGVPLFSRLQWAHKIETNLFSRTSNKVVPVGVTLCGLSCQTLATRTLEHICIPCRY